MSLRPSRYPRVFTDGRDFYTENLTPGKRVYGERIWREGEREFRRWDPYRSKLSALLHKGCMDFPFHSRTRVLYLGAATGTTASHLSDICVEGTVFCVEISRKAFQGLMSLSRSRPNMYPVLSDAGKPEGYAVLVNVVDVLYEDVAQRNQVEIFLRNWKFVRPGGYGILMLKSRSVDVAKPPETIFQSTRNQLSAAGLSIIEVTRLEPYEKDHFAFLTKMPLDRTRLRDSREPRDGAGNTTD